MRSLSPGNIFVVSTKKRPEKAPELRAFLNAVKLISSHSCGQLFFQINTLVISFPPFNFVFNSELNGDHGYLAMYASQRIPALPNRTKKKAEDDYFILGSDPCHRISGRNKNCPAPPGTGLFGYSFWRIPATVASIAGAKSEWSRDSVGTLSGFSRKLVGASFSNISGMAYPNKQTEKM